MARLTSVYYSQYDMSENETGFDSDSSEARVTLMDHSFYEYLEACKYTLSRHEHWKNTVCTDRDVARVIEEHCGMRVSLGEDCVKYNYIPKINNEPDKAFQSKIIIKYSPILRRWYLSRGYSHVPPTIDLREYLIGGTKNPIGSRALKVVNDVKNLIDSHMKRLEYTENFIAFVHEMYMGIVIRVNRSYTQLKMLLSDEGWPRGIKKTCNSDNIILNIVLNEQLKVSELSYVYKHAKDTPRDIKEQCEKTLEERTRVFLNLSLQEAFDFFMEGF